MKLEPAVIELEGPDLVGHTPRTALYWRPATETAKARRARSVLIFVHGFGEHAGRYRDIIGHFPEQHALALDLRGHGHSEGRRGHVERFEDYHLDLDRALAAAAERAPGLPQILVGHSFGGLLACHYCMREPAPALRGLVLSSPALQFRYRPPIWERWAAAIANQLWPGFTRPARLAVDRLSHDPAVAERVRQDPMAFNQASARWYFEALRAQRQVCSQPERLRLPTLCLFAGDDALVNPEVTRRFLAEVPDVEAECYPDCYHELFQERERAEILSRVAAQCRVWEST